MKVKNVIKGLKTRYNLEEINVISSERVIYSGPLNKWVETEPCMIVFKREIENKEVTKSLMFNGRKAFLFV